MLHSIWVQYEHSSDPSDNLWISCRYDFLLYLTEDEDKADKIFDQIVADQNKYVMNSYQKTHLLSVDIDIKLSDFPKWYAAQRSAGLATYKTLQCRGHCNTEQRPYIPKLDTLINITVPPT